jgi:hypothetical protein
MFDVRLSSRLRSSSPCQTARTNTARTHNPLDTGERLRLHHPPEAVQAAGGGLIVLRRRHRVPCRVRPRGGLPVRKALAGRPPLSIVVSVVKAAAGFNR